MIIQNKGSYCKATLLFKNISINRNLVTINCERYTFRKTRGKSN